MRSVLYRHYEKYKNYGKMFQIYHLWTKDEEIKEICRYLRKHPFSMINYELTMDYNNMAVNVEYDAECDMHYVLDNNRKLYFPKNMAVQEVITQYRALKKEQDGNSPHCYLNEKDLERIKNRKKAGRKIRLFELGAMEGMFSLNLIDMVDEVHIFECEPNWAHALEKTFAPYSAKTCIVNKYVSDVNDDEHVCLDDYIKEISTDDYIVVKMDIEGAEMLALKGMAWVIRQAETFTFFVCTYHKYDDERMVRELFGNDGYEIENTKGYFCFYRASDYAPPFVRRCILKINKWGVENDAAI